MLSKWQIQVLLLKAFWDFFSNIFDPWLVESKNAKPVDIENLLYKVFVFQTMLQHYIYTLLFTFLRIFLFFSFLFFYCCSRVVVPIPPPHYIL